MVLEAVYGSFDAVVGNRLAVRFGWLARYLTPLLTWQVKPRLGFDPAALAPAARIGRMHAPLLLIAGDADRLASLGAERSDEQSRAADMRGLMATVLGQQA